MPIGVLIGSVALVPDVDRLERWLKGMHRCEIRAQNTTGVEFLSDPVCQEIGKRAARGITALIKKQVGQDRGGDTDAKGLTFRTFKQKEK